MKKTNSPFSIETDTSFNDGRDALGYVFVTCSSAITGRKSTRCHGNAKSSRGGIGLMSEKTCFGDHSPLLPSHRAATYDSPAICRCLRHRMPASMKESISPSKTAVGLPVSYSVRRSLTIWYG